MTSKILMSAAAAAMMAISGAAYAAEPSKADRATVMLDTKGTGAVMMEGGPKGINESTAGQGDASAGVAGTPRTFQLRQQDGRLVTITIGDNGDYEINESVAGQGDASANIPGTPRAENKSD